MPDFSLISSAVPSKYHIEIAAMLGAFLSLAHRGLKPIASLIAFVGGAVVSAVFGSPVANWLQISQDWVFPFGFLLGSISWSVFGGLLRLFERFRENPIQTVKDVKEIVQ